MPPGPALVQSYEEEQAHDMKIAFNLYRREEPWCLKLLPADVDLGKKTLNMFDNMLVNATVVYDFSDDDLAYMVASGPKVKFVVVMCSNRCFDSAEIFRSRAEAENWIRTFFGCGESNIGDATNGPKDVEIGKFVKRSDDQSYGVCLGDDYFEFRIILETEVEISDILEAVGRREASLKYELYNNNHGETGPRFHWYPFDGGPELISLRSHTEIFEIVSDTLGTPGPHELICYVSGQCSKAKADELMDAVKAKHPECSVRIGQGNGEWAIEIKRGQVNQKWSVETCSSTKQDEEGIPF
jgi:hypothetical protein